MILKSLLDLDIYGPSLPIALDLFDQPKMTPEKKLIPLEKYGLQVMSFGFISGNKTPVIWRGPLVSRMTEQFFMDVEWGSLDFLILDLPPGTGDIQLSIIEILPLRGALIVTTPQDIALIDAHKALSMFETLQVKVLGVVENMADYVCPSCGHREGVFGQASYQEFVEQRRVESIAKIPLQMSIRQGADQGSPASLKSGSSEAKIFEQLAEEVNKRL